MMKKYIASLKELKQSFSYKALFDACIGAFVFALIVMAPVFIVLIQLLVVFMYKVRTFTILLIVAALFFNIIYHRLFKQVLIKKNGETKAIVDKVTNPVMLVTTFVLLVLGLVILFVMIPIWLV